MHWIHSRHFQICGIDEYWRIPYMKVSSRVYASIYARMAENNDKYFVFAYSPRLSYVWFRININGSQQMNSFLCNFLCCIYTFAWVARRIARQIARQIARRTTSVPITYSLCHSLRHSPCHLWCSLSKGFSKHDSKGTNGDSHYVYEHVNVPTHVKTVHWHRSTRMFVQVVRQGTSTNV